MVFPRIHFAKPHPIVHHPLSDNQVFCHLFEPAAVRFGQELRGLEFSRNGWCALFKTRDQKKWIITYLGNGESKITPRSSHDQLHFYFEDFEASLTTPSMKTVCEEYGKRTLALGTEPLPNQPLVLSARKVLRYLWLPLINKIAGPSQKWITSFQFSAENWCARFVLNDELKGVIVYRGKKSYRTSLGLTDKGFDRIGTLFNATEELPS